MGGFGDDGHIRQEQLLDRAGIHTEEAQIAVSGGRFDLEIGDCKFLAPEFAGDLFAFDFSGYDLSNVTLNGFMTAEVPEPAAWALMLFGLLALGGFRKFTR